MINKRAVILGVLICAAVVITVRSFASEKYSHGQCEFVNDEKVLYCEDDQNNVCLIVFYDDGFKKIGCRKKEIKKD